MPDVPGGHAHSRYLAAYWRGVWEQKIVGDLGAALYHYRIAVHEMRRLDPKYSPWRIDAEQRLASALGEIGFYRSAEEIHRRLLEEPESGDPATLLNNVAWGRLLRLESQRIGTAEDELATLDIETDVIALLESARELYLEQESPEDQILVELNLALAYLHAGRPARAGESLRRVRDIPISVPEDYLTWWFDLDARIAEAENRPDDAYDLYLELERLARSPEARWRALIGQARILHAQKRFREARSASRKAEDIAARDILSLPSSARETFPRRRELGARIHLETLLELDEIETALQVARRSLLLSPAGSRDSRTAS